MFSRLSNAEVEERSSGWEGAALPANIDRHLAVLEQRMDELEASKARLPERREYTDKEIVEIYLGLLCYICEGSTQKFAEFLVKNLGAPFEEAEEIAGKFGRILEERRAVAPNPRHPV
jgi:hypothetical protein